MKRALLVALVLAAVFASRPVIQWNLQGAVFMRVVVRLIDKGELERAARLCEAAPGALLARAVLPVLACALTQPAAPLTALAAVTRTALEQGEAQLRSWTWVGAGAGLSLGVAVLASAATFDPTQPAALIVCGTALLLLLAGGRRVWLLHSDLQTMPVSLLQPLVKALSGREPEPAEIVQAVLAAPAGARIPG